MKFYDLLLRTIKPFVVWWGKLHMPFTVKKVTGKHYYLLRDQINVGTVLLTTTRGELSNIINPEKIKHAGIYVGDLDGDGVRYVLEAKGRGVCKTDLVTFMTTKDLILGCEPNFLEYGDQVEITNQSKKLIGIPYDYLFNKSKESLYCFEACAYLLNLVRPEIQFNCREIVKGKRIYSYKSFLDTRLFRLVFDSDEV